mgnify:CR=1 FL=1
MTPAVGVTLQPDEAYLELLQPVCAGVDYFEAAQGTTWRPSTGDDA